MVSETGLRQMSKKYGKCPSRLRWFISGIVWDIAMLIPFGKVYLALIEWSGCVYCWATYDDMKKHYKYMNGQL